MYYDYEEECLKSLEKYQRKLKNLYNAMDDVRIE